MIKTILTDINYFYKAKIQSFLNYYIQNNLKIHINLKNWLKLLINN